MKNLFSLDNLPVVVTGAAGVLGGSHCRAIARAGGIPVLLDSDGDALEKLASALAAERLPFLTYEVDSTKELDVSTVARAVESETGPVYGIVNNVARNPKMATNRARSGHIEHYSLRDWKKDHSVALDSAFLTAKYFGPQLVRRGRGSIVNIASDLALISPDQRLYMVANLQDSDQPKKPMSYSSTKSAVLGITRYLATYWSPLPIRSNALIPGSVSGTQSTELTERLKHLIPLARLASQDEYQGAIVFMLSAASEYMNGATLTMDGGRSAW